MLMKKGKKTLFLTLAVFVGFFSYFNWTSEVLPLGSGLDFSSHDDIVRFIYQHGRLAVFPEDEDQLKYTVYGSTRALRPPMAYFVSAALARLQHFALLNTDGSLSQDARLAFRKGSVLLGSLALAVGFYALFVYFNSLNKALIGVLLAGLMPQFTFIASYNNDDSGAIFSATLLILALILIFRRGPGWRNIMLLGLSGGLVILSKQTAWLLAPSVLFFLALFVRIPLKNGTVKAAAVLVLAMLGGGWWLLWNIYHYGLHDPFLFHLTQSLAEKYQRFSGHAPRGYHARGIGMPELLLNRDGFLTKTFVSTVGNLDWLRLRVAPAVYWVYKAVVLIAGGWFVFATFNRIRARRVMDRDEKREYAFQALLFFMLAFQFFMYMVVNEYNDIQLQGKYLIPVWLPLVILFLAGATNISEFVVNKMSCEKCGHLTVHLPRTALVWVFAAVILLLHLFSLFYYVAPFYGRVQHEMVVYPFEPVKLPVKGAFLHDIANLEQRGEGFVFESTGDDPFLVLGERFCRKMRGNRLVRVKMRSETSGRLGLTIIERKGEQGHSTQTRFSIGENELYLGVSSRTCQLIRFDFGRYPGKFVIDQLATARIDIDKNHPPDYPPF
ncbi:MAG: hypothetical protein DSZ33_01085 [Gammaproteobacteria bacterium]|nr:MAG: hypothetical protein DSZ33_01085 [Gammaproteobacteria bacterium]